MNWRRVATTVLILAIPLLLTRCLITKVSQPATANKGQHIVDTLNIFDSSLPSLGQETDRGVLCALVPNDWSFDSCSYTAQEKGSSVIHQGVAALAANWGDSAEATIASGPNYKWIGMLSDSAYKYTDTLFMTVKVYLAVGQTSGTFNIGFLTTKNASGLINDFANAAVDTAMNNRIVVSTTGVETEALGGKPTEYSLTQNYPNPFNPSTTIHFALKERADVRLSVVDIEGREVAVLTQGSHEAGEYLVKFAPENMASGIYFYTLTAGQFTQTRKMVFAK